MVHGMDLITIVQHGSIFIKPRTSVRSETSSPWHGDVSGQTPSPGQWADGNIGIARVIGL